MNTYKVIGVMSGTSLDGVDIAYCIFNKSENKWLYKIVKATTLEYTNKWRNKLKTLDTQDAFTFVKIHVEYGHYLGNLINDFIKRNDLSVDFVASHGHTIFHQPDKRFTCQIGDGAAIVSNTKLSVVYDFRSLDVALNGQGAPLVPVGDNLLFSEYDYCLNLGGFANISFNDNNKRIAHDICPVNIILNKLAEESGKKYDDKGKIARNGIINEYLLKDLNKITFYKQSPPKSLGKEWLEHVFIPVLYKYDISLADKLRTIVEHIAIQISLVLKNPNKNKILITGGGVYNDFLMDCIKSKTKHEIIIPDRNIIDYKEALIFAFLGVLRMRQEPNCLKSATGAEKDNVGGAIYYGK